MIGELSEGDAAEALAAPAEPLGVVYEPDAVKAIIAYAQDAVEAKLDSSFFRVRTDRVTELELQYMRAMAELGSEPQPAKGPLYTPTHGLAAFYRSAVRPRYASRPCP